jgi:hypothetical protein
VVVFAGVLTGGDAEPVDPDEARIVSLKTRMADAYRAARTARVLDAFPAMGCRSRRGHMIIGSR